MLLSRAGPRFYEELEQRSLRRFGVAVSAAMFTCLLLYGGTALFGYIAFGVDVKGNVLKNFAGPYAGVHTGL